MHIPVIRSGVITTLDYIRGIEKLFFINILNLYEQNYCILCQIHWDLVVFASTVARARG